MKHKKYFFIKIIYFNKYSIISVFLCSVIDFYYFFIYLFNALSFLILNISISLCYILIYINNVKILVKLWEVKYVSRFEVFLVVFVIFYNSHKILLGDHY